jgi:hypothetical protein
MSKMVDGMEEGASEGFTCAGVALDGLTGEVSRYDLRRVTGIIGQ